MEEAQRNTARVLPMFTLVDVPADDDIGTSTITEWDLRITYMRPRMAPHPETHLPYHCSTCTPVASPMSMLCNNWATERTRFGRLNILTFRQPQHFPDRSARQASMTFTKRMAIPADKMALEILISHTTFLVMVGEATIPIFNVAPAMPTHITDRNVPDTILAEVKEYIAFMGCNVEVLQLSLPVLQRDNSIIILPFSNNFVTPTARIGGWACHRFVIPLFITKWTEYSPSHRFHPHYLGPTPISPQPSQPQHQPSHAI